MAEEKETTIKISKVITQTMETKVPTEVQIGVTGIMIVAFIYLTNVDLTKKMEENKIKWKKNKQRKNQKKH